MRVLVTGGTGFVGAWTAKAVAEAGHQVRFLVRNPARLATSAAQIGVDTGDYAVGDIADASSTAAAMDGCDAVIHSAAMVSIDPRQADAMLRTNLAGARNVLGTAADRGLDPIVHVSSFTALFRPGCHRLHADLPVAGGSDGYGKSKAEVEKYARGLQESGAPVSITYPGMVLGPPAGDQFGEAAQGVQAAIQMRGVPGRGAAWTVVDVRDLATLHSALLEPGKGPRRYMAGGRRVEIADLASMIGRAAGVSLRVYPIPDVLLRNIGRVVDVVGPYLPFDAPMTAAAMQYYTQMPSCDDSPSENELGITYRDPQETLADTVSGLRRLGRV
ncbi:SDR family NAD(P)-dependent oxidoreductase [Mycolicibacterium elephantis]|uniref:Oxidoreductase n=1 Tax=Mycolicibacterium elephantis TaxID=81858 RepID=A0A0M2ZQU7_9MYCO|nr:SDR family NAD(P)-dependent oxidoreductase [Mycolicibacterium elephantis]KKW66605.1 oxidoreductase [Mycolicibacterium elephantis]OBA86457.1 oxidoreductase [Mycolicibacterium elephantis]OBE98252.1 oxidoreductase [Mycolicibacterium elephantis]ORA69309.1 oxidoreductase [Mycolicibacterium elephantis]